MRCSALMVLMSSIHVAGSAWHANLVSTADRAACLILRQRPQRLAVARSVSWMVALQTEGALAMA